jgi:hypothetical protein
MNVLLFAGCLIGTARWMPAQGQDSAGQTSAVQTSSVQTTARQTEATPAAAGSVAEAPAGKPGFPLDEFTEFSGVMIGSMEPRDKREGYIYRSGNLIRSEGPLEKGYYITDLTKQVAYSQTRLGCVKDGHPYFRAWPFIASRAGHASVRVVVGKETLDGRVCQVEDVTITGKDLITPAKLRFWEPEEWHGFPIKIEDLNSKGNRIVQFKDVVLGPQDPTFFIYPSNCEGGLPQPDKKRSAGRPKMKPPVTPPPAANPQQ